MQYTYTLTGRVAKENSETDHYIKGSGIFDSDEEAKRWAEGTVELERMSSSSGWTINVELTKDNNPSDRIIGLNILIG